LMWELERALLALTGMDRMSLQPAAGAHGEWTGLRIIQAHHRSRGERRDQVLVPDSAHGTNHASATLPRLPTLTVETGTDGPGAGPVGVKTHLPPYLPLPTVERDGERYRLDYERPQSIGKVRVFYGNFGMLVRAYAYIRAYGSTIDEFAQNAVLNASYLRHHLRRHFDDAFPGPSMHEFVLTARRAKEHGVRAVDVAKRLIDLGFHPPTVYFPLIVPEALMIEPTETESKASLDGFNAAREQMAK